MEAVGRNFFIRPHPSPYPHQTKHFPGEILVGWQWACRCDATPSPSPSGSLWHRAKAAETTGEQAKNPFRKINCFMICFMNWAKILTQVWIWAVSENLSAFQDFQPQNRGSEGACGLFSYPAGLFLRSSISSLRAACSTDYFISGEEAFE